VEHPSDGVLELYSIGCLTEAEMAPLEEHLLICDECRYWLVLMEFDIAVIGEAMRLRREESAEG
jgi:hypothetical protein